MVQIYFKITFVSILLFLCNLGQAQDSSNYYYSIGIGASHSKDTVSAIYNFTKAIEFSPSDSAYYQRACIESNYENVIKDCNKAIELNSNNADAYLLRGLNERGPFNFTAALNDFNRVIEIVKKNDKAYLIYKYCVQITLLLLLTLTQQLHLTQIMLKRICNVALPIGN
jgi:tetratricopeptide (TPR) repeat protein